MAAITVDQLQVLITANSKDLDEKLAKINSQVGQVGEQTSKTGGKMSAAFSAIGKATGVALIAAGTGLTALAVSSVKSFAQYEQLVGGVETLFKNSSKQVLEYANSAYKTWAYQLISTWSKQHHSLLDYLGTLVVTPPR